MAFQEQGTIKLRVLYAGSSDADMRLAVRQLESEGFEVAAGLARTPETFAVELDTRAHDLVLAEFESSPQWPGYSALQLWKQRAGIIPFISVVATVNEKEAFECVRRGATDYVLKSNLERLPWAVWKALDDAAARKAPIQSKGTLAEGEQRLRLLLDSIPQAIIVLDGESRCTFSNKACLRLLGYSDPGDLLGKNIHSVCHPTRAGGDPSRPEECRACQALRKGEEIHIEDEFLRRADGTSFRAEYWSQPMLEGGKAAGALVTLLDRTHGETGRTTADFLRNISHELRTLMNGIMGMAQLALDTELTAEQRDYLESLKTSAEVLLTTINNILEFFGLENGKTQSSSDRVRPA